jgi:hypothetical protein
VSKQQTLVADFDLNGGLVGFLLGAKSDYSIVDVVKNLYRLDLSYWKGVVSNGRPGLSVVRAPSTTVRGDPPNSAELRQVVRFAKSLYPWTIWAAACAPPQSICYPSLMKSTLFSLSKSPFCTVPSKPCESCWRPESGKTASN